jgi:exopolysaccharide production protein ExoQ
MTIRRELVKAASDYYAILVVMLASEAFLPLFVNPNDLSEGQSGSPVLKVIWASIYIITLLRLVSRRREIAALMSANKALVLLPLLAFLSLLWSLSPAATLHQATTLGLSALIAIDFSLHYTVKRQLQLISIALGIVMVSSIAVQLLAPTLIAGSDMEGSAWHGVFGRKNEFGRMVCLATTVWLTRGSWSRRTRYVTIAVGLALAALSQSAGAMIYLVLLIGVIILCSILKWRPLPRKITLAALTFTLMLGIFLLPGHSPRLTAMIGKDSHMSGRTDLWSVAIADIQDAPVAGYGYQAFWTPNSRPATLAREEAGWEDAPHAHNGYIDLALGLGLIGLGTYLVLCTTLAARAYAFWMAGSEDYRRWPLSFLALVSLYQISETSIVGGNNIFWIIFCGLLFSLTPVQESEVQERAFLAPAAT